MLRLVAILVALASGCLFIRHSKAMLFEGVGVEEGGGWAVLVMMEFVACASALAIAVYVHS